MIRITQLLNGTGTVGPALKYRNAEPSEVPRPVLAFTETRRPVVFWNMTRKCNLSCTHCYIDAGPDAADTSPHGELSHEEAKAFIADLAAIKIPLLMFTVLHGYDRPSVEACAGRLSGTIGIDDYRVIFSTKQFKRTSIIHDIQTFPPR